MQFNTTKKTLHNYFLERKKSQNRPCLMCTNVWDMILFKNFKKSWTICKKSEMDIWVAKIGWYDNYFATRVLILFVYQKALIRTLHASFLTTLKPLWFHSTRKKIQKVIVYSKTGFKRSFLKIYGIQK